MKKSWKIILSLCLILALLLSLCACGEKEKGSSAAGTPAQAASEPTAGLMTVYVPAQVATPEPTAAPMITPEPTATPEPAPKTAAGTGVCGDYEYEYYTDGTACITKYNDRETVVVIPSELDGYSVTAIGDWAFGDCSVTSVTIPDSVIEMGANPFMDCNFLTQIIVSASHPALEVIDGVLFDKNEKRLITYSCAFTAKEYAIPQGIMKIGDYAFYYCTSLTAVTIPDSVTEIGDWAFFYCKSLTAVTIPEGVTAIGDDAFFWCTSLTAVTIPDSVTEIGANPFEDCSKLVKINVSPDHPTLTVIDGVLFEKTSERLVTYPCAFTAAEYTIPQGIREIGDNAFYGCTSLTAVTIPEGVTAIGYSAFYYCDSLTAVTIPDSVTSIDEWAFADCPNLTLTVPRDSYAEQYCKENRITYQYADAYDWLLN